MQPQLEQESLILKYLTYAFLGVLALVVIIIAYNENKEPLVDTYPEPVDVPEINLLSAEEVEIERSKILVTNSIQAKHTQSNSVTPASTQTTQTPLTASTKKQVIPSEEVEEYEMPIVQETTQVKRVKEIKADGTIVYETVNQDPIAQSKVVVNEEALLEASDTGEKIFMKFSGMVYSLGQNNNTIVMTTSNNQGFVTFQYDNKTNFLVNNKQFSANNLKVGDLITVEGSGYSGTRHLTNTKNVILQGVYFINT